MFIKDIETLNHEKKIRGFFTVTVYIFAVSFLAILLSIYYIFVWSNPNIQAYCWYMKVRQKQRLTDVEGLNYIVLAFFLVDM